MGDNMTTGLKLVVSSVLYFVAVFIVLTNMNLSSAQVSAGSLNDLNTTFDPTQGADDVSNVSVFDIFTGLLVFDVPGLPWWVSLLALYLPILMLLLGIYAIIRGI